MEHSQNIPFREKLRHGKAINWQTFINVQIREMIYLEATKQLNLKAEVNSIVACVTW